MLWVNRIEPLKHLHYRTRLLHANVYSGSASPKAGGRQRAKLIRSDYCTVDGVGIVPYKVTKYRRTKAFKSVVMVSYIGSGQAS